MSKEFDKLAIRVANTVFVPELPPTEMQVVKFARDLFTELESQLSASEEAGMIILPTTCPECSTKDIEYARMCHNSKCKGYAMEFSVYEGWRAAPQPHKD